MFKFLKSDPAKQLQKQFEQLSEKAFLAQRNGDIRSYSELTAEAELVKQKLDALKTD